MITLIFLLLVCHLLADFSPLSTGWMLRAKSKGAPLFPIFIHAGIHALLMLIVLLCFITTESALQLAALQWISHFAIDVWKGKMSVWFPVLANSSDKRFWMLFGFDQFLHQTVILVMIAYTI
jgi:hypothetical protein